MRSRRLVSADAGQILQLATLEGLTPAILARELACDDYLWVGLEEEPGQLLAVHRALRWGGRLLLKGVFVAPAARGGGAAVQVAFALRDLARQADYAGIAAWLEPHRPEAGLAHLLRLRPDGPLLHRFQVPLTRAFHHVPVSPRDGTHSGTLTLAEEQVHWVLDRHRLLLSRPLPSPPPAVRSLAVDQGASALEVCIPAADLPAVLSLAARKARRLSRTPVHLARLDFAEGAR